MNASGHQGTLAIDVQELTKVFHRPLTRLRRWLKRRSPPEVVALRDVSLEVAPGEIFGLAGRNGQGKTTLVKAIAALLPPTAGSARVFGFDTARAAQEVKQRVGLVASDERSFYWRLTGRQNMLFFARLYGLEERPATARIRELFDLFELGEIADRPFSEYSNGNKQRLALARALLPDPALLLLDEPTRSLDPIAAGALRRLIRARINGAEGRTVLITSHNLAEIEELCGRVAILSRGRVKECAPLDELRGRFAAREVVRLRVRRVAEDGTPALLPDDPGGVACRRVAPGLVEIRVARRAGDSRLHGVVARLVAAGAEIVSADTERLGLKEIMEEIECGGPAA